MKYCENECTPQGTCIYRGEVTSRNFPNIRLKQLSLVISLVISPSRRNIKALPNQTIKNIILAICFSLFIPNGVLFAPACALLITLIVINKS